MIKSFGFRASIELYTILRSPNTLSKVSGLYISGRALSGYG